MSEDQMKQISSEDAVAIFRKWLEEKATIAVTGVLLLGSPAVAFGFSIKRGLVTSVEASSVRVESPEGAYLAVPLSGVNFSYVEPNAIPDSAFEGGDRRSAKFEGCIRLSSRELYNCFFFELRS